VPKVCLVSGKLLIQNDWALVPRRRRALPARRASGAGAGAASTETAKDETIIATANRYIVRCPGDRAPLIHRSRKHCR
jgi:hypothetical protein